MTRARPQVCKPVSGGRHAAADLSRNRAPRHDPGAFTLQGQRQHIGAHEPTARPQCAHLNGTTEIQGSRGEISGAHVSETTSLWLQTMVPLTAGDTVELQGYFRVVDGYFAADHTSFWGAKVG